MLQDFGTWIFDAQGKRMTVEEMLEDEELMLLWVMRARERERKGYEDLMKKEIKCLPSVGAQDEHLAVLANASTRQKDEHLRHRLFLEDADNEAQAWGMTAGAAVLIDKYVSELVDRASLEAEQFETWEQGMLQTYSHLAIDNKTFLHRRSPPLPPRSMAPRKFDSSSTPLKICNLEAQHLSGWLGFQLGWLGFQSQDTAVSKEQRDTSVLPAPLVNQMVIKEYEDYLWQQYSDALRSWNREGGWWRSVSAKSCSNTKIPDGANRAGVLEDDAVISTSTQVEAVCEVEEEEDFCIAPVSDVGWRIPHHKVWETRPPQPPKISKKSHFPSVVHATQAVLWLNQRD